MLTLSELFDLQYTEHPALFDSITYPWEVIPKIEAYILEYLKRFGKDESDIIIGEGTRIDPLARIVGPAIIGKNCEIRAGAFLRGRVILGNGVIVGNSSEIKNAFIFNEAQMPHFNYVGDSILGYRAHLGGGAILSNLKALPGFVTVKGKEKKYDTGLQKFGALVGDFAEIGCHVVLNPGSVIGKNSILYPLVSWRGVLPPESIVKLKQQQEIIKRQEK